MILKGKRVRDVVNIMVQKGVLRQHACLTVGRKIREQGSKVLCERCQKPAAVTTGSMFDTKMICIPCEVLEKKHQMYHQARKIEGDAVAQGNYNFEGIGLPSDWDEFTKAHDKG